MTNELTTQVPQVEGEQEGPTIAAIAQSFIVLSDKKKALEADLEDVKNKLADLETKLREMFQKDGIDSIKIGGRSVYMARELWPKLPQPGDDGLVEVRMSEAEAQELLCLDISSPCEDEGQEPMVSVRIDPKSAMVLSLKRDPETASMVSETYNTQTLRGYIGRLDEDPETLLPIIPEHLEGVLCISEKYVIRTRKG